MSYAVDKRHFGELLIPRHRIEKSCFLHCAVRVYNEHVDLFTNSQSVNTFRHKLLAVLLKAPVAVECKTFH